MRSRGISPLVLFTVLVSVGAEDHNPSQAPRGSCVSPPVPSSVGNSIGGGAAAKRTVEAHRSALLQQRTRGSDVAVDAVVEGGARAAAKKTRTASKGVVSATRLSGSTNVASLLIDKSHAVLETVSSIRGIKPRAGVASAPLAGRRSGKSSSHAGAPAIQSPHSSRGALNFFQTGSEENHSSTDPSADSDYQTGEAEEDGEIEETDADGDVVRSSAMEATTTAAALVVVALLAFLVLAAAACRVIAAGALTVKKSLRTRTSSLRQRAQQIRVTSGAEVQSMFAVEGDRLVTQQQPPSQSASDLARRGVPMRVQGRVASEPEARLLAPFSGRPCAIYSASTSHNRQDGVHQPPVAFHSAGIDFTIELLGAPSVSIAVHSQDVSLFDMASGRVASERTFEEAPDSWRAFTLAHLTPGRDVGSSGMIHVGAGVSGQGPLEFCECALVIGSIVTCIGEIARDRNGGLHLYPWRPPSNWEPSPQSKPWFSKAVPWLTTPWQSRDLAREALGEAPTRDTLANHVLISDELALLV